MVERQVVARGVETELVLAAMRAAPRHRFVPEEQLPSAYADSALPIGHGQTISQPFVVAFMTEGPCVVMALEGEDAIVRNRQIMGATNPADAADGTLRKRFATNIERNAVHGSDSPENAAIELAYFFRTTELF